jgi:hypothetical protein
MPATCVVNVYVTVASSTRYDSLQHSSYPLSALHCLHVFATHSVLLLLLLLQVMLGVVLLLLVQGRVLTSC